MQMPRQLPSQSAVADKTIYRVPCHWHRSIFTLWTIPCISLKISMQYGKFREDAKGRKIRQLCKKQSTDLFLSPLCLCHLAVLNSFSQNKAASLPICSSLSTTDFCSYINSGCMSKCYFRKINKWIIQSCSDNDTIHGGDWHARN